MADKKTDSDATVDPDVNSQAQRPGMVEPQRTPGSAPSVVPLPKGADPKHPDEHPTPEEAIAGYPPVQDEGQGTEVVAAQTAAAEEPKTASKSAPPSSKSNK